MLASQDYVTRMGWAHGVIPQIMSHDHVTRQGWVYEIHHPVINWKLSFGLGLVATMLLSNCRIMIHHFEGTQ